MTVKGTWPRPQSVTSEELSLRHDYMEQRIDREEFDRRFETLMKAGLIKRNGRVVQYEQTEGE